ncbi:MAG: RND family transporter [Chloroflexi bacterium]|nr:RND family transporter [Chloroflexota bacterium]
MQKIGDFIYRRSRLIIILTAIITIASLVSFFRFSFDTDFMSAFTGGNPKAEEYNRLIAKYQTGEPVQVLLESDTSLLSKENMLAIFHLQQDIAEIAGIAQVQGPLPPGISLPGQVIAINAAFIEANHPQLRDFIENRYFLTDQFLAGDRKSGILMVTLVPKAAGREVVTALEAVTGRYGQFEISLAGDEVVKDTLWDYLLRIIFILPPVVIILVLTVFALMLRNRRMAALSLVPAALGALWTFGTVFWSGGGLSVVTILTPLFIIIVGSAYGLHYTSHLLDNLGQYAGDRRKLTIETLQRVGIPIFLAAITTMAGFASLIWTNVMPMRQMGIYVTLGIGYAGLLAIFFLPAVLSRIKLPQKPSVSSENRLTRFVLAATKKRALIIGIFAAITVTAIVYVPRIEVLSNQLMFFKEGSEIRQTFAKVEEHFGGAMPLTGEIAAADIQAALLDSQYAGEVLRLERELENVPGIASAFSVFDLIKGVNKMTTGQDAYPQNPVLVQGLIAQMGESKTSWIADDGFRLLVKTKDFTSEDIAGLESFVQSHGSITIITGLPVLFSEMNDLIVRSQVQSLGLALVVIFFMLWITLRRLMAALVGLVPIAITIAAILGMLALTRFNLSIMTATLSAIAVGIGIDYSIHLLASINYYRGRGAGRNESVVQALSTVSRPIMANALGLVAGYSALFFSPLRIHTHVAAVMWVAMLVSSTAALLLVPIFYSRASAAPRLKTRQQRSQDGLVP